jgi:hypothetical protein
MLLEEKKQEVTKQNNMGKNIWTFVYHKPYHLEPENKH